MFSEDGAGDAEGTGGRAEIEASIRKSFLHKHDWIINFGKLKTSVCVYLSIRLQVCFLT